MRAMILAAGRGNRLRPLTDHCPKPLIQVQSKPLIVYHLENLSKAGVTQVVINLRYLGEQILAYLGDGKKWGMQITYSSEAKELEVGGGIFNALPLLGKDPFLLVNGDIWTDYPFVKLPSHPKGLAHLVLVDNPLHNPEGDFSLNKEGQLSREPYQKLTYSGLSVLHPALFSDCVEGTSFRLAPLLDKAAAKQALYGEHYHGEWTDVGTIERLQELEKKLASKLIESKMF
ncbi:MAG: mannose-1-phosphate guanylyltransferase [Gammaproteobacteria bacterium 39-13]|nr:nucleotidyltransferase family protein [Gammaproteobacteria bacterium]OJV90595.1 MAG: mannose-1-phosphate guanylyltransferase [Gammaproteobacteria bacterium 39-13]